MRHNFKESLAIGKKGEAMFAHYMPGLVALNGKGSDFVDADGNLWELKSDQYDMDKTANFFIEEWSDFEKKKPGGPFQAMTNKSKYWCYYFPKNGRVFIFETEKLVDWLNQSLAKYDAVMVPNHAWITIGHKVPREHLKSLYREVQFA